MRDDQPLKRCELVINGPIADAVIETIAARFGPPTVDRGVLTVEGVDHAGGGRRRLGWSRRLGTPAPQLATLGLLVGVLVVVGFFPAGTLSVVVTAVIAFAAGMQIAAFRTSVGRRSPPR